jgi:DNA-binding Lrp family transcriptional regulator
LKAVLLIRVVPTKEKIVGELLSSFEEVEDCWVTFGEYDVVAILSGSDSKSIADFVTKKVRQLEGVNKTSTLLAID